MLVVQSVIDQVFGFEDWEFYFSREARMVNSKSSHSWTYEESAGFGQVVPVLFANIVIEAECDFFVGALSSNRVRMVNELRVTSGRLANGFVALNVGEY